MKRIILLGLISLFLVGCSSTQEIPPKDKNAEKKIAKNIIETAQNNIYQQMKELENKEDIKCDFYDPHGMQNRFFLGEFKFILKDKLIVKKRPILASGKIYCVIDNLSRSISNKYSVNVIEKGLINGIEYDIYYSDLSGHVGKDSLTGSDYWGFGCDIDKMNDNKECFVSNNKSNVDIYKNKNGYMLQIGWDHYPDRSVSIRINKNKQQKSWREDGTFNYKISKDIIKSIRNNDEVYVRYVKWPYDNEITNQLDVSSFNEAIKLLNIIYDMR